jgi:hypothetical protein
MKKVLHCCLAHPCWSGISGIVAVVTLLTALKWPDNAKASGVPPTGTLGSEVSVPEIIPPAPTTNLSGKWTIESDFTNSTFKAFEGLNLLYSVGIVQTGDAIMVNGEKDSEKKGRSPRIIYERSARTKFRGDGNIKSLNGKQTIQLEVKEGSTTRGEISSKCNLEVINEDLMEGTFSTQAASATGKCTWRRVNQ